MTIHLPEDLERSIRAEVLTGHFASVDDALATAWRSFLGQGTLDQAARKPVADEQASALSHRPIWEEIEENTAGIPDKEFLKLRVDGAEQHDHYVYATPTRPPSQ